MKASELLAQPRCKVVCYDKDNGSIVRCARWHGHEPADEHMSYEEVIENMCQVLAIKRGKDIDDLGLPVQMVIVKQAKYWHKRLVVHNAE